MRQLRLRTEARRYAWGAIAISVLLFVVMAAIAENLPVGQIRMAAIGILVVSALVVGGVGLLWLEQYPARVRWDSERIYLQGLLSNWCASFAEVQAAKLFRPTSPAGRVKIELEVPADSGLKKLVCLHGGVELAELFCVIAERAPSAPLKISERNKYKTWTDSDLPRVSGRVELPHDWSMHSDRDAASGLAVEAEEAKA